MKDKNKLEDDKESSLNGIRDQLNSTKAAASQNAGKDSLDAERLDSTALEDYLASRLQQVGEVSSELKEFKGLKTGNGWNPDEVVEYFYKIDPISMKRAAEVAVASNRTLRERVARLFRKPKQSGSITGTPIVEFVPIWRLRGFHECYFLRTNSYRVNVRNDVVGVEVEGLGRDLILERKHLRFIPSAIVDRFQMFSSFLTSDSKYFVVNDVTELATKRSESEMVISGTGHPLNDEEEMMLTSWRAKRVFDTIDLKVRGASVKVREPALSKEMVLEKFRERVVRMPERFKQILSSRLQITELKRIYIPFIRVPVQRGLVPRDVIINGTSGELVERELLDLLD